MSCSNPRPSCEGCSGTPPTVHSTHYNQGVLDLAFVFSAPGQEEKGQGWPVAGWTGKHLCIALQWLHDARGTEEFPSPCRYDYRITNAWFDPLWEKKDGRTEANKGEIVDKKNVERVLDELSGCRLVVLCGVRAQYLHSAIQEVGFEVISICHLSPQSINKYKVPASLLTGRERTIERCHRWADDLLTKIKEPPLQPAIQVGSAKETKEVNILNIK